MNSFGLKYELILDPNFEFGFWNRLNTVLITWQYLSQTIKIEIQKGTLVQELVSADGKFLVLIFRNSQEFPDPCNCVVYSLEGEVHKVVCAPCMVSEEAINYHQGDKAVQGIIGGVSNFKRNNGDQYMVIGIRDSKKYYNTGTSYGEIRAFDPETGEIGALLEVSLPLK